MLLTVNVQHLESTISALITVLTFALPLVTGFLVLCVAAWTQLTKAIRTNRQTLEQIASQTNGKLDTMAQQVGEIHDNTLDAGGRRTNGPGIGTGRATDPGGAAVPPPVAPVHPVDAQSPPGD